MVGAPTSPSLDILVEPRVITEADIDWLWDICQRRYAKKFDGATTEGWFRNIVFKQPVLFYPARMPNAFSVSMLSVVPWLPSEFECNVVMLCCEEGAIWEGIKLCRASIEWAKLRKCTNWKVSSDTAHELDAIARRIGATEVSPRFIMRL